MTGNSLKVAAVLLVSLGATRLMAQGPPFQTDDPVPVDLHHYEFYIFGAADGTPVERDFTGPAFEFNWGAISRLQLHGGGSSNPRAAGGGAAARITTSR